MASDSTAIDLMNKIKSAEKGGSSKKVAIQTGSGQITYATYNNKTDTWNTETRSGGTANLRTNNPGNIIANAGTRKYDGVIGTRVDPEGREFLIFDSMEKGEKATIELLKTSRYQNAPAVPSLGIKEGTIGAAIYRYAPPNENDTAAYIADVEKYSGMDKNTPMTTSNKQLQNVATAIFNHEGNKQYSSTLGNITNSSSNPLKIEGVELKNGNVNSLKQKAEEQRQYYKQRAKDKINSLGILSNKFTPNTNVQTLSAAQIKAILEGSNFSQNILDHYDNPVYRIRIWALSEADMQNLSFTAIVDEEIFKGKKYEIIYDSAVTTSYGVDNLQINSKIGVNSYTKKVFVLDFSFDLFEPNGCLFFDRLKQILFHKLGYLDHRQVIFFLEISFVGTYGPDEPKDPLGATIIGEKRIVPFIITEVRSTVDMSGAKHKVRCACAPHAIGTLKDYYNFSKKIEIDQNVTSFKSVMQEVVNKLNECAQENILSYVSKSENLPDGVVFKINFDDVPNDPKIDWNIVKNSGESSLWHSGKYTIEPGYSFEKVLDDITCSLDTNTTLNVTNRDKTISPNEWPCLYRCEPSIRYCGQLPSTKQKIYEITYNIRRYYDTAMILSMPVDKDLQTTYINNLIQEIGSPLEKKYEYIFTSKNTQILKLDIDLDMLWWVPTYENIADRPADNSSCVSTQNLIHDALVASYKKDQAIVNGVEIRTQLGERKIVEKSKWKNEILPNLSVGQAVGTFVKDVGFITLSGEQLHEEELLDLAVRTPIELENEYNMYDVCVWPGNFPYSKSGMNQDATNRNDVKAKSSFEQLYKTGNMITLNMTIKGDPYWLCNPVTDRYRSNAQLVFIMKTPADTGDSATNYLTTNTLWGVYDVIDIRHSFSKGLFTQDITAVANPNYRIPV